LYNDLVEDFTTATTPSAPSGLSAAAGVGQVSLSWSASSGALSYNVKRSAANGGPYTTIASAISYTTYVDTSVTNGTIYYYVVSALNSGQQSVNSARVSATPVVPQLSAPIGLTATAGNAQVSLSWSASPVASSYNVKRNAVGGEPYTIIAASISSTSYADNSVSNGITYYYVVSAANSTAQSADSAQTSARPLPPPPTAPVGLTAAAAIDQVALSWTADPAAAGYNLRRATTSGGPYTIIITVDYGSTYTDSSVSAGTTYYYVLSTVSPYGLESANSAEVSATPGGPSITQNGIVPIYSSAATIQPGSWISIFGSNLAAAATTWNNNFPTTLGGVSVTVNNKSAYLWYVSPTQINLQAPGDAATGSVNVAVTNSGGTATSTVMLAPFGPSFSLLDGKHVAGIVLRSNGSGAYGGGTYDIVGPTGTSLGYPTVAAKASDTLELFGVGFGPTSPPVPAGQLFSGAAATTNPVQLTIGGATVLPSFAGLTSAGLYQINVTIPAGLGTGDLTLAATVGGVQTQSGVVISLQ
jgi:uncharacterized protein (TIGR03437 family)